MVKNSDVIYDIVVQQYETTKFRQDRLVLSYPWKLGFIALYHREILKFGNMKVQRTYSGNNNTYLTDRVLYALVFYYDLWSIDSFRVYLHYLVYKYFLLNFQEEIHVLRLCTRQVTHGASRTGGNQDEQHFVDEIKRQKSQNKCTHVSESRDYYS